MGAFIKTLFTFVLSCSAFSEAFRPPKIYFDEEYIAPPESDLTIRCEGSEPIQWTPPNNPIGPHITKYSNVSSSKDMDVSNKEYRYVSTLKITNTSFLDVGFYCCHGINASLDDPRRSSKIYIYVLDEHELTVLTDEVETVYNIAQYEETVIPCRPTAPNINVRLYRSSSDIQGLKWEKIPIGEDLDNGYRLDIYDPRYGFVFRYSRDIPQEEIYQENNIFMCAFTRGLQARNITVLEIVQPKTTSIAKPYIEDMNLGHTKVGDTLIMKCTLSTSVHFTMKWNLPHNKSIDGKRIIQDQVESLNDNKHYRLLRVHNATKADEGNYTCFVEDHAEHRNNNSMFIRIFEIGEHFIYLSEENDVYNISVKAGETVQWRIDIDAHPVDNLVVQWLDNNNEIVEWDGRHGGHFEINHTKSDAFLKITSVSINDLGNYTLIVSNDYERKDLKLTLTVKDKPSVHIDSDDFHFINIISEISCVAAGYPEPNIFWSFTPCLDKSCLTEEVVPTKVYRNGLQNISSINIKAETSGYLTCYANNSIGYDKVTVPYFITDVKNGFNLWYSDNLVKPRKSSVLKVSMGDEIQLFCAASIYNYTKNTIQWFRGTTPITNDDDYLIERSHTDYSYKSTLIILNASKNHSGDYFCKITDDAMTFKEANLTFQVLEPEFPYIYESNFEKDISMDLPDSLQLICRAAGLPKPTITWFKDNVEINFDNRTELLEDGEVLNFRKTVESDEGKYSCRSYNKLGEDSKDTNVTFRNKLSDRTTKIIIGVLTIILLIFMFILIIKVRKEAKLRAELKKTGLNNFEAGQVDCLNPELGVDDQAELLPYDKKWEFPRDKIKLGKQLGSGAFGVVMKAEAQGIIEGEASTTVAVKMVKKNADHALIKALASELKIMVHLGKHINVVNLLGACTKNVVKRELLVIVEYCRYGNLQNYLLRHREHFIDQIDMNTGKINYSIGSEALEDRSMSFSSNRSNSQSSKSPVLKYVSIKFPKHSGEGHDNRLMADYRAGNPSLVNYSVNTETTTVTMSPSGDTDDLLSMSNSSGMQPEWRSNYRGDYKGNVKPICTKDLLAWAFQVARAMEYLASRKVLHGDLAARNILLADNNVVKVCDFGLAKSMYNSGNYKKKGDGPLPVKWMAVESLRDRVFSTQSDVWSFGIVLWEFFSLGRMPYPGMEADERLYHKLLNGYRMDAPNFATREIHQMMMSCWEAKPQQRPSFTLLAEQIGYMLEESVKEFYIELNDPYLVMNTNRLEEGQSDYLAMFSPPDFETLSSPQDYINESIGENQPNGYMCMKPNQIFSPREVDAEGEMFTFQVEKPLDGDSPELSPMLNSREGDSDNENTNSPKTPSFSNPSYLALPDVTHVDGEILQSTQDNYVNMPKNKSAIAAGKGGPEWPYVNSTTRDWEKIDV